MEARRAALPRPHRPPRVLDPRDGKTLLAAARDRAPRPDGVPLDRRRPHVEGGAQPPAFAPGSGRAVDHAFWLTPGHASEPGVWYAGTSPQGLFRTDDGGATWDGVAGFNDHPQRKRGAAATRTARPTGRSCTRSSSTRATPRTCTSACRAAACSSRATAAPTGGRSTTACAPMFLPDRRIPSTATIRTACASPAAIPTGSSSRTTAASTGSTGPQRAGAHRRRTCRRRSATSAFRWSRTRAIPTPRGCSRWTAPTSGRARRPAASRRCIARATAARAGSGRRRACPKRRRGGR